MLVPQHKISRVSEYKLGMRSEVSVDEFTRTLGERNARACISYAMRAAKRIVRTLYFQGVDKSICQETGVLKGLALQHQVHHMLLDFTVGRVRELWLRYPARLLTE